MRRFNLWLGVCLTLAAFAFACGGSNGSPVEISGEVAVSAVVALTEARIEGLLACMQVMAVAEEVKSGEWDVMQEMLAKFQETSIPLAAWFVLPDGSYYTVDVGRASANLSDRAYFPKVISGEIAVGYLVMSRSTGRAAMVLAVPVESDGQVIGALGVSVFLVELAELIMTDLGSPDLVFYALSDDGKIALHSDTDLVMADVSALGAAPERAVCDGSSLLGWTFVLGEAE
jgi:hypothetical protein